MSSGESDANSTCVVSEKLTARGETPSAGSGPGCESWRQQEGQTVLGAGRRAQRARTDGVRHHQSHTGMHRVPAAAEARQHGLRPCRAVWLLKHQAVDVHHRIRRDDQVCDLPFCEPPLRHLNGLVQRRLPGVVCGPAGTASDTLLRRRGLVARHSTCGACEAALVQRLVEGGHVHLEAQPLSTARRQHELQSAAGSAGRARRSVWRHTHQHLEQLRPSR